MANSKNNQQSYAELSQELESIMFELQRDDIDIDKAIGDYERGLELVKKIEEYLKSAENKITKLKSQFSADQ
jgi:exodeoxyribonuclease VII small subunit